MKCAQLQPLLIDYLHDHLSGPQLEQVERHLTHCSRCRGELKQLRTVDDALEQELSQLRETPVPADVSRSWKQSLSDQNSQPPGRGLGWFRRSLRNWSRTQQSVAALIVVCLLLFGAGALFTPGWPIAVGEQQVQKQSPDRPNLIARFNQTVNNDDLTLSIESLFSDGSETLLLMGLQPQGQYDISSNQASLSDEWGNTYQLSTAVWEEINNGGDLVGLLQFQPVKEQTRYIVLHIERVVGQPVLVRIQVPVYFHQGQPVPRTEAGPG